MCKAPKPPKQKEPKKPMFLKNRYLDEFVGDAQAVNSLRTGRSSLRMDLGSALAVGDRVPGSSLVNPTTQRREPTPNPNPGRPLIDPIDRQDRRSRR